MPRPPSSPAVAGGSTPPWRGAFLPFREPWIDEDDIQEVVATLGSGSLAMGPKTLQLEHAFAGYVGARHAVALSRCGAGIHAALDTIGVRPGDEVITSVCAAPAIVAAILHLRARPVLVDVRPDDLTVDPAAVAARVTERTRVVLPLHFGGAPCDMDRLLQLAARHGLKLVEDAGHAIPARYRGRTIGSIGDLTVFGFDSTKPLAAAEGAIITTDRDDYADGLRSCRLEDPPRRAGSRETECPGYRHPMTDLNAAVALQQLRKADMFHAIRSYHAGLYTLGLSDVPELVLPEAEPGVSQHAWHLYVIQLRRDQLTIDGSTFVRLLAEYDIGSIVPLHPLSLHPEYRHLLQAHPDEFPRALEAYRQAVALPVYPRMSEASVWGVIRAVRDVVERHRRAPAPRVRHRRRPSGRGLSQRQRPGRGAGDALPPPASPTTS
jgi:dTDP-4-amino-4,6-dideoxygalactose transaminase